MSNVGRCIVCREVDAAFVYGNWGYRFECHMACLGDLIGTLSEHHERWRRDRERLRDKEYLRGLLEEMGWAPKGENEG